MKQLFLLAAITMVTFNSFAQAAISPTKRVEIEKMLKLAGIENLMSQMISQMISAQKPTIPDASQDFWIKFESKMDSKELLTQLIPLESTEFWPL